MFEAADFLWLATHVEAATPEVIAALRLSLAELSFAYAGLDSNGGLRPADGFTGYLKAAQGDWRVFVPWPLVTSFPGSAALAALLDVGSRVAVAPVSSLCISGTSAWLGRDIVVSDLDFCQYLRLAPADIVTAAAAFVTPCLGRVLLSARYGGHPPAAPPWPETWPALKTVMEPRTSIDGAERFMIDFLARHPNFGSLLVSNVVLASDLLDRNRGAAARSFVFQEAVAVPATHEQVQPPWSLVDASQIAEYLAFLRRDIARYAETQPIKAVKRAISLSATIRLPEIAETGIDILTTPATARYVARKRVADVEAALIGCGAAERGMVGDPSAAPASGDGDPDRDIESESVLAAARDLVRRLLSRLDEIEATMHRPEPG